MPQLTSIPHVVDARDRLVAAIAEHGAIDIRDLETDGRGFEPGSTLDPAGTWRAVIAEVVPLGGGRGALVAADVQPRDWSGEDRALLATLASAFTRSLQASSPGRADPGHW
jgi:GAF domain-containing protein